MTWHHLAGRACTNSVRMVFSAIRQRPRTAMSKPERPDTPCIAVCSTALGDDVCRGCGRSVQEVAMWVMLGDDEKEAVWQRLEQFWAERNLVPPWERRG